MTVGPVGGPKMADGVLKGGGNGGNDENSGH